MMTLHLNAIVEGPKSAKLGAKHGADASGTLVFIHGWPDDATLWDEHVAVLSNRYRCVRATMPNFDGRRTARWGYGTDEIVGALAEMIREVAPGEKVTLILHDWGCYWGHLLHHRHPELVARVAGLDVAPHLEPSPAAMLGIIAYQWWLLGAFVVGGPIGDAMTRMLAGAMKAPVPRAKIHSWMNYPYRNVWRDIFAGRAREMESYWPEVPLLFVYAKKKPFPFHSQKWLDHVEKTGGTVVGLECDHWVSRAPEFGAILENWLAG